MAANGEFAKRMEGSTTSSHGGPGRFGGGLPCAPRAAAAPGTRAERGLTPINCSHVAHSGTQMEKIWDKLCFTMHSNLTKLAISRQQTGS